VPVRHAFEYAMIRVVPHVGREEFVNVGVVLFARAAAFLGCEIALDAPRLRALAGASAPALDLDTLSEHLQAMRAVCAGEAAAGPIARLPPPERFHWLVAPRSTAIQISPVHGGVSDDPAATLRHLFRTLVAC
jgi:Protein of unknown function (DUF3037)